MEAYTRILKFLLRIKDTKWINGIIPKMAHRIFFFLFSLFIFIYFFKYETIEIHARAFLTLNILAIGRVPSPTHPCCMNISTTVFPRIVSVETILFLIFKTLKISYSFHIKFSLM